MSWMHDKNKAHFWKQTYKGSDVAQCEKCPIQRRFDGNRWQWRPSSIDLGIWRTDELPPCTDNSKSKENIMTKPSTDATTILNAEQKTALDRTKAEINQIVELCKANDMPVSLFPQVLELYETRYREICVEKAKQEAAASARRLPMAVSSGSRIAPGSLTKITVRHQLIAYRVEEIEITKNPARWLIRDIQIGNRSQTPANTIIPGEAFRMGGIMTTLRLETCQTAMDLHLIVEYVGPEKEGEIFEASLVGTAVEY